MHGLRLSCVGASLACVAAVSSLSAPLDGEGNPTPERPPSVSHVIAHNAAANGGNIADTTGSSVEKYVGDGNFDEEAFPPLGRLAAEGTAQSRNAPGLRRRAGAAVAKGYAQCSACICANGVRGRNPPTVARDATARHSTATSGPSPSPGPAPAPAPVPRLGFADEPSAKPDAAPGAGDIATRAPIVAADAPGRRSSSPTIPAPESGSRKLQRRMVFAVGNILGSLGVSFHKEIKTLGGAVGVLVGPCKEECSYQEAQALQKAGKDQYCSADYEPPESAKTGTPSGTAS